MKVIINIRSVVLVLLILPILSCSESESPIAKPRMYPKVIFPEKNQVVLTNEECGFSFSYPDYLVYGRDSVRFEEHFRYPCWFDLTTQQLNTTIHFSYLNMKSQKDLDTHINDAFKLADEHNIKATARKENIIENSEENVFGLLFEFDGDVAAPLQFFVTDSSKHFLRASLYFNDKVNQDSTKIIYDFIKEDIENLIRTLRWKS
ncbi:MAG TPA: gliding motility protein GldD [Saprospiraceae bacterium]|nr:gliding motility protein GldD [Saprospiraceae bacterium]